MRHQVSAPRPARARMPGRLLFSSAAIALAASSAWPDTAAADDGAASTAAVAAAAAATSDLGPEITVTARHREEKLQNVPIAISVIGSDTLEKTDDYSLNQFQHEVPSLQVVNTNPRNSVITIRGLGANSAVAVDGLEYGVGFYLDGVYYGRPGQSQFDLADLQQVEVLRGPQGTLFGKNTTAGAINITSQLPSFTPTLSAEATFGNYGTRLLRASVSAPLIADRLAFRLTAADTHHDGYLTNLYDGSKAENYDDVSVRGQLLFTPTPDLKIRLIGDFSRERQHYILNLLDGYFTTYGNGTPIPNNILQRVARGGYSIPNYTLPPYGAFARLGDSNSPFQANMKSYGVSGQIDYDLGRATVTSITAYRWWDWYPANDGDGLPLAINLKAQQQNFQRQFSQELRVASNGHHFIDYLAGLYYFWQTVPGYGASQFGSDFVRWSFPPTTPAPTLAFLNTALSGAEADSYSVANTKSYAAFGQIDTHLTDRLTLTTGLRFTHEDKNGLFERYQNPASVAQLSVLTPALLNTFALSNLSFAAVTHNSALSGLATLGYRLTPDASVYGTYSRGNQSGGLNITAGGVLNPVVKPEKVDNFEVGIKSQFLGRALTVNADVFLTQVRDYQANISLTNAQNVTIQYISNIPKVRTRGVEGDIAYAPDKWVSLSGSLAYTDAKYVSYADAPAALDNPTASGIQNLSGVALPGVSKFAYTLVADLARPLSRTLEGYARADYLHRSSFNTSTTNSAYSLVPAYGVLDGRIGIHTADRQYDLSIWAKNLTNRNYYVSRTAAATGLITAVVGDPRTYGATLRVKL